jgi:phosphocarrier protein
MEFVDLASSFASDVRVRRTDSSDDHVDGKSIMQMMMLAATMGTVLEIVCTGDDADHAANTLAELIETGFHEE